MPHDDAAGVLFMYATPHATVIILVRTRSPDLARAVASHPLQMLPHYDLNTRL